MNELNVSFVIKNGSGNGPDCENISQKFPPVNICVFVVKILSLENISHVNGLVSDFPQSIIITIRRVFIQIKQSIINFAVLIVSVEKILFTIFICFEFFNFFKKFVECLTSCKLLEYQGSVFNEKIGLINDAFTELILILFQRIVNVLCYLFCVAFLYFFQKGFKLNWVLTNFLFATEVRSRLTIDDQIGNHLIVNKLSNFNSDFVLFLTELLKL